MKVERVEELMEYIVSLRKARGWTQARLAREAGVSQSALSRYESGTTRPGVDVLSRILAPLHRWLIVHVEEPSCSG